MKLNKDAALGKMIAEEIISINTLKMFDSK